MAGCSLLAACQLDPIDIPADELYTREFIKNYGLIHSDQDWSVVKRGAVTVTTTQTTNVQIFTILGGDKTILLGSFSEVSGTQTLEFDCPKETETVLVKTLSTFEIVPLDGELIIGPESRGSSGTDALPGYTIENGWYCGPKFLSAVQTKLPEGDPSNMNRKDIVADFNFVSDGNEFALYPIGWQTTANDVLGVYWYKNGKMYTKDIFDNMKMEGGVKYHNILTRATYGGPLNVLLSDISDGTVNVPLSGSFTLSFNRNIKQTGSHSATLNGSSLSLVSIEGNEVTYQFSNLAPDTKYTFKLSKGSFEAIKKPGERDDAKNDEYTFSFTTEDKRAKWKKTTVTLDATGLAGTVAVEFDRAVSKGSCALTFVPATGITQGDIISSTDNTTITVPFSGCDYSTTYTVTPASGFASHPDGILMGKDKDMKVEFTTTKKTIKYNSVATVVGFDEEVVKHPTQNNTLSENFTPETQILTSNDYLSATLLYDPTGKPLKNDSQFSNIMFPVAGGASTSFGIAFKSKVYLDSFELYNNGYAGIYLNSTSDLLLSVYGFPDKNTNELVPTIYDLDNKVYLTSYEDPHYDTQTVQDKDGKDCTYTAYSVKFEIKAGHYLVFIDKSTNGLIAGFAYQLPDEPQDTEDTGITSSRGSKTRTITKYNHQLYSNQRSRAEESDDLPLDIWRIADYDEDYAINTEGYFRTQMTSKEAVSTKGEDEVITHRISFTLPKGTIFGFYIRNNNGAAQITGDGNNPQPYTNYSMSSLNQTMKNSFFNRLDLSKNDAAYFAEGWGTEDKGNKNGDYHDKLKDSNGKFIKVSESRKYSTASTYTVDANGDGEMNRYFSFEDWVDYDFNDIVFLIDPASNADVVDGDVETNPYIFAVEDLGATTASDIDFNDVVFAVEHLAGCDSAFVTVLAAGGTLKTDLCYDGKVIGREIGDIVDGPLTPGTSLAHINQWFGHNNHGAVINAGAGIEHSFDELTTVRIPVDPTKFTIVDAHKADLSKLGFSIRVEREDGTWDDITRPDHTGEAPQIIILPGTWSWPMEKMPIMQAYPGGLDKDGNFTPSFKEWVNGGDGKGYKNTKWHLSPAEGTVIEHPWEGSDAARKYFYNHMEER